MARPEISLVRQNGTAAARRPRCLNPQKGKMARPEGFEPPAPRFVVWCSIQLSYGRAVGWHIGDGFGGRKPVARESRRA